VFPRHRRPVDDDPAEVLFRAGVVPAAGSFHPARNIELRRSEDMLREFVSRASGRGRIPRELLHELRDRFSYLLSDAERMLHRQDPSLDRLRYMVRDVIEELLRRS
jgi:hypothetical protein